MKRPTIAIVTGFTKSELLLQQSFDPLRGLVRDGVIDRVLYVTWDRPDLDAYIDPVRGFSEIELVRIPEAPVSGSPLYKGVVHQIRNLSEALALVPEDEALIVKLRPDFVAQRRFLEDKIRGFDTLCAPSRLDECFGVSMPASPFTARIWVPWADANLPLHIEDAAFIGLKNDVAKLADPAAAALMQVPIPSLNGYGWYSHAVRYATALLPHYPIFAGYVENFRLFLNDSAYRMIMMPQAMKHTFMWRLIVANAWILATMFHVDCGAPGQLSFFPGTLNTDADWSRPATLKIKPPYNAVEHWREAQCPGGMLPGVGRINARLVDDRWQQALFTSPQLRDLTPDNLRGALRLIAAFRSDVPDPAEAALFNELAGLYRDFCATDAARHAV